MIKKKESDLIYGKKCILIFDDGMQTTQFLLQTSLGYYSRDSFSNFRCFYGAARIISYNISEWGNVLKSRSILHRYKSLPF